MNLRRARLMYSFCSDRLKHFKMTSVNRLLSYFSMPLCDAALSRWARGYLHQFLDQTFITGVIDCTLMTSGLLSTQEQIYWSEDK